MAERKTRREYFAVGAVITERRYHPDGSKSDRFYATTKCNGGEASGRELDDAFQAAQVLNAHDGMQDRLVDAFVRLECLSLAAEEAISHWSTTGTLSAGVAGDLLAAIEEARKPRR